MVDVQELPAVVALMRSLGVTEYSGIRLGPAPSAPAAEQTYAEKYQTRLAQCRAKYENMLAHTGRVLDDETICRLEGLRYDEEAP
jgi:hypothetical protein